MSVTDKGCAAMDPKLIFPHDTPVDPICAYVVLGEGITRLRCFRFEMRLPYLRD